MLLEKAVIRVTAQVLLEAGTALKMLKIPLEVIAPEAPKVLLVEIQVVPVTLSAKAGVPAVMAAIMILRVTRVATVKPLVV
jgi:hypothetical protein